MAKEAARDDQPQDAAVAFLRQVSIFRDLDENALKALAAAAQWRTYRSGELISGPEDEHGNVLALLRGNARLYRLSSGGAQFMLGTLHAGDIFGLVFLDPTLEPKNCVEATVDGTLVCSISTEHFRHLLVSHPDLALRTSIVLSQRIEEARDRLGDLALPGVKPRLARTLARLASENERLTVYATHHELALMTGTSREKVTKTLRQFRELSLISYEPHRRGITVLDLDRLMTLRTTR